MRSMQGMHTHSRYHQGNVYNQISKTEQAELCSDVTKITLMSTGEIEISSQTPPLELKKNLD